jgi:hypothetical protein
MNHLICLEIGRVTGMVGIVSNPYIDMALPTARREKRGAASVTDNPVPLYQAVYYVIISRAKLNYTTSQAGGF